MKSMLKKIILATLLFYSSAAVSGVAAAEDKLTLTVTPPLFQLTIGRGENWSSNLKVVNTNSYDLTVYASLMDFQANGEEGQAKLIPADTGNSTSSVQTLARWIEIARGPVLVPAAKSVEIPFMVRIPEQAEPGGYYAAILVGTSPMADKTKGPMVTVASMVSTLLLVRVNGDIREEGSIREFSADKFFSSNPDISFNLRFANDGNVHLQPQGEITIYTMWGKEAGKIPINQQGEFGNVLPHSVRKFVFDWRGENNFFDAGRYSALISLAYGQEARSAASQVAYFWVVPLKPILAILAGAGLFILFILLIVRVYVRRSLRAVERRLKVSTKVRHK